MENKITYENIHHALKCCWIQSTCGECPYHDDDPDIMECTSELAKDAMILLESLKKDNDRLLKSLNLTQQEQYTNGKNDGIREFAERLKKQAYYPYANSVWKVVTVGDIDCIVKEMTEAPE